MSRVLLVPDLPLERWPSMDRYASRLVHHMDAEIAGVEIAVASDIGSLTDNAAQNLAPRDSGPGAHRLGTKIDRLELRRYMSRYWLYPRRIRKMKADLIHILDHSYAHIVLAEKQRPRIVTVHDLFPVITLRQAAGGWRERLRNWMLGKVVKGIRQADAWIVATKWLREQLAEWLGTAENMHVIPYGVDDAFFGDPDEDRALKRDQWGIPESAFVILHVGSVDKRKNLPAIIAVLDELRASGVEAWLLQVGGKLTPEHNAEISTRDVQEHVTQLGPVTEADLRNAYHAADVLLFPSHYEGFGFPVLEAMASGLPVVTSGAGGLTEVAGDAAVVVGGRETEPYTEATIRIASDPEWRAELVARGRDRAALFTWSRAAADTAKVYEDLV